jgi:cellulose synthase/poly-beta-1,6-N-acetylglucosamine synthase-like glycosyltransferase
VPVKDEDLVISRCIEALLSQNYPKKLLEIIIVDGNSRDGTRKICEAYACDNPGIQVIDQGGTIGKPAALNDGLRIVRGDIVGVFDADNVPEPDVLMKAAVCFENKDVDALQGRTVSINEDQNRISKVSAIEEKIWLHTVYCRDRLHLFVPLTGSCQFVRREIVMSLGGWTEDALAEDVDLALKMIQGGYHISYQRDIVSWQENPSSLKSLYIQRLRWYMGNLQNFMRYGKLIRNPSKKTLDAEFTLISPGITAISTIPFFISFYQLIFNKGLFTFPSQFSLLLPSMTWFLIGLLLAASQKPFKFRNLVWVPFIYTYWILQSFVACWAVIQLCSNKERVWKKTEKVGVITKHPFLGDKK